jgi:uncharacterized protein YcbK (DUF882 family)
MDRDQLTCHCGCKENDATDELFEKLQALEAKFGRSLCVTSGYRCPSWNRNPRVGGSLTSYHVTGQAADIACDMAEMPRLAAIARIVGFGGLGFNVYKGFLHIDLGPIRKFEYDIHGKVTPYAGPKPDCQ